MIWQQAAARLVKGMTITETDVRQYVQDAMSAEDIQQAITVVETLQGSTLAECHVFNAALIAIAIAQAKMQGHSQTTTETDTDRQLLRRALQRSLRLPRE